MFEHGENRQRNLDEAYWKGVEKARQTGVLEDVMEGMTDLVVPISLCAEEYQAYKAGYRDYATGKIKPEPPRVQPEGITLDALEKAWYGLCNAEDFLAEETVRPYRDQLHARGNVAAVLVGLSDFTETSCPSCATSGHYKIHFLGKLRHPQCGAEWDMAPGGYIGFQLASVYHSGLRAGSGMKDDADRKGEKGSWIVAIVGFLMVAVFRAALACALIPIQAGVSLSQDKRKN